MHETTLAAMGKESPKAASSLTTELAWGHATEADRIFGIKFSCADKTLIKPSMLSNYQYNSGIVNIYSDSTDPAAMGQQPVDDECVPACFRNINVKVNI